MTEPVTLRTATKPPLAVDAEVVTALEKLLAQAKAGEFNGLCVVTITSPAVGSYTGCGTLFSGEAVRGGVHIALGGVEVLRARLLRAGIQFDD